MAKNKKIQKIIIAVDHKGDCSIQSPPDMDISEVLEVLVAAVDAASEKAEKMEDARTKEVTQDAIDFLKNKTDLPN